MENETEIKIEKQKIYLELFKTEMNRFNQTREIQWKINIAFWTFILLAGSFLYGKYQLTCLHASIFFIVFLLLHWAWIDTTKRSIMDNKNLYTSYRDKLHSFLSFELEEQKKPDDKGFWGISRGKLWTFLQIAVTAVFMFVTLFFLMQKGVEKKIISNKKNIPVIHKTEPNKPK